MGPCVVCGAPPSEVDAADSGRPLPEIIRLRGPGKARVVYVGAGALLAALGTACLVALVVLVGAALAAARPLLSTAGEEAGRVAASLPVRPSSAPTATLPALAPTPLPVLPPVQPTATMAPQPATATPVPPTPTPSIWIVANTGGQGVYIRRAPATGERIRAWPDGTRLERAGEDRVSEGRTWRQIKDPAGNVGWVPAEYLAASPSS